MLRLIVLAALALGGFLAYRRFTQRPEEDWDEDIMYESAELHRAADASTT